MPRPFLLLALLAAGCVTERRPFNQPLTEAERIGQAREELGNADPGQRILGLYTLHGLTDPEALELNAAALKDPDRRVREQARKNQDAALALLRDRRQALAGARSPNEEMRRWSLEVLGKKLDATSLEASRPLLEDPAPAVRVNAIRNAALGGDGEAAPALERLAAEDPEPRVRLHAGWALARLGRKERTALLLSSLSDQNPDTAFLALVLLDDLAPSDVPDLAARLGPLASSKSPQLRERAADMLNRMGKEGARTLLLSRGEEADFIRTPAWQQAVITVAREASPEDFPLLRRARGALSTAPAEKDPALAELKATVTAALGVK